MVFIRELPQDPIRAVRGGRPVNLVHPTHALKPLIGRLHRMKKPCVLDLGSAEGPTLEFFTKNGCRVWVEDLAAALPQPSQSPRSARVRRVRPRQAPPRLLADRYPSDRLFDLILCWNLLDLMPVEAAAALVGEFRAHLPCGGMVWAFFDSVSAAPVEYRRRFRIRCEENLDHVLQPDRSVVRFVHQNRDILSMFEGFEVLSSTFLRVGLREMLFRRLPDPAE
jgi:hypothetical protein